MKSLEPLPSQQPVSPGRALGGSPHQSAAGGQRAPASADRRPSPPATTGRRPAGEPEPMRPAGRVVRADRPPSTLQASFRFDELAHQVVVTLVRPETQEVVRQIPPEKILRMVADLRQRYAELLDQKA